MDTEQRQLIVAERMSELKAIHLPLTRPCSECRFGPLDGTARGICEHYANWQVVGDPVTGKRSGSVHVSTMTARGEDGLCGPEGLLFEGRSRGQKVARYFALRGPWPLYFGFLGLVGVTAVILEALAK